LGRKSRSEHDPLQALRPQNVEETTMRMLGLICAVTIALATPALADRPVTAEEREKLVAVLAALGCTGGEMEVDEEAFAVEEATCNDGKSYNFEFDSEFKLLFREVAVAD
jgi:hypothetical protein